VGHTDRGVNLRSGATFSALWSQIDCGHSGRCDVHDASRAPRCCRSGITGTCSGGECTDSLWALFLPTSIFADLQKKGTLTDMLERTLDARDIGGFRVCANGRKESAPDSAFGAAPRLEQKSRYPSLIRSPSNPEWSRNQQGVRRIHRTPLRLVSGGDAV
jgi:hypothetical protein